MAKKLLQPEGARDFLSRRYDNQHQTWLGGGGSWPLSVPLGAPTEREVAEDICDIREWVSAWAAWREAGEVVWEVRRWPRLGTQRLPVRLVVQSPDDLAILVGQRERWCTALERFRRMTTRWPALARGSALSAKFEVLADYSAEDFERLFSLISWLDANPASQLYVRQIPVRGLDTKWVEQRTGVVAALARAIRDLPDENDFHSLCGLKKPPHRVRVRVLCPELRKAVGGLRDIKAPTEELAMVPFAPLTCLIVENVETGLAMPDLHGAVCVMGLGNAVAALGALPWLRGTPAVYWGDIDTYGFAILDRARRELPQLCSVLMDEGTLLSYRALCGQEAAQCPDIELPNLYEHERHVYEGLRTHVWGHRVRLEQERLPWEAAMAAVRNVLKDTTRLLPLDQDAPL